MDSCSIDENIKTSNLPFYLTKIGGTLPRRRMRRFKVVGVVVCSLLIISTGVFALGNNVCKNEECPATDTNSKTQQMKTRRPQIFTQAHSNTKTYPIVLVADLDDRSRLEEGKEVWQSFLMEGELVWDGAESFQVRLEDPISIQSDYSRGGRGMELSELVMFNGDLLSVDDRTGIIFKLRRKNNLKWDVIPWIVLTDGGGDERKGLKAEWMTVKDNKLYVGGLGKEWTSIRGEYINDDPMFIKIVAPDGSIDHVPWKENYLKFREHLNISTPGYVIHEAVMWSRLLERWVFLPRRVSHLIYNDIEDEKRGSNMMVLCSEDLRSYEIKRIGTIIPTRGFSSFKFLPETNEQIIVALKSEEDDGKIATYITVFNLRGDVLMNDVKVGSEKYEGIEFL